MIKKTLMAIAVMICTLFTGCDAINKIVNNVDAETYAKYAGKAVAVVVNTSTTFFKNDKVANIKDVFVSTITTVATTMPKDIAYSNVTATVNAIVEKKIAETTKDESLKAVYTTALNAVYSLINQSLDVVAKKYPTEFADADKAYALISAFFNAAKDGFDTKVAAVKTTEETDKTYEEILKEIQKLAATSNVVAK